MPQYSCFMIFVPVLLIENLFYLKDSHIKISSKIKHSLDSGVIYRCSVNYAIQGIAPKIAGKSLQKLFESCFILSFFPFFINNQ